LIAIYFFTAFLWPIRRFYDSQSLRFSALGSDLYLVAPAAFFRPASNCTGEFAASAFGGSREYARMRRLK